MVVKVKTLYRDSLVPDEVISGQAKTQCPSNNYNPWCEITRTSISWVSVAFTVVFKKKKKKPPEPFKILLTSKKLKQASFQ